MFAHACSLAQQFTRPILISFRSVNGECKCGIGSFVVLNEEGWFVTANHIIAQIVSLEHSKSSHLDLMAKRDAIIKDTTLIDHNKKKRLKELQIDNNSIVNYSVFLGWPGVTLNAELFVNPVADVAVGKLIGFDPSFVRHYPVIKNPNTNILSGTSLCKLGFPFHDITPSWDDTTQSFTLPPGAFPPPLFPIEGIVTRFPHVQQNTPRGVINAKFIETSSPGLRGQSGGPTFDVQGRVWAIQSSTHHLKLGFGDTLKKDKESEHLKNQYLHVGHGTHCETLVEILTTNGIRFNMSDD